MNAFQFICHLAFFYRALTCRHYSQILWVILPRSGLQHAWLLHHGCPDKWHNSKETTEDSAQQSHLPGRSLKPAQRLIDALIDYSTSVTPNKNFQAQLRASSNLVLLRSDCNSHQPRLTSAQLAARLGERRCLTRFGCMTFLGSLHARY